MIDVERDFERMRDYLSGRLPEEEQRSFEDRLVRDPELVRELEQSLRLRAGLEALRAHGHLAKRPVARRGSWLWAPVLAAAGVAAVALFLSLPPRVTPAGLLMASPAAAGAAGGSAPIAAHFTFVAMRGGSTPELELPAGGLIELRAAPASSASGARFRLTLAVQNEGGSSKPLGIVTGLWPGADGYVHSYADASRLSAGRYLLRVESETGTSGTAEIFPFSLRAAGVRPPQ